MILIRKPAAPPARLALGVRLTADSCRSVERYLDAYRSGTKRLTFSPTVYGHASVKRVLEQIQHKKCCYCEGHFDGHAPGDIEHYRPKDGVQQELGVAVEFPGYYWLAYEWSNLYFSCPDCNRVAKRRLFPLSNPARRARTHLGNIRAERPLLLDPGGPANPRQHIRFHQEIPVGVTRRGKMTVRVVQLDREALNERRRTHLAYLRRVRDSIALLQGDARASARKYVADAKAIIAQAAQTDALFSAMAQDFLVRSA